MSCYARHSEYHSNSHFMSDLVRLYIHADEQHHETARKFAEQQHLPLYNNETNGLCLLFASTGYELTDLSTKATIRVTFTEGSLAHRVKFANSYKQPLAKAIGVTNKSKPTVLDITAGLARDAYVLYSLGCSVTMVEASAVLATMIQQAIDYSNQTDNENIINCESFKIVNSDSLTYMQNLNIEVPDVIYMDPMYPERKKSALVKKDMQILHKLIGPPSDELNRNLLNQALQLARQRVVIKRPENASEIDGPPPTLKFSSKKTRYDVYVIKALTNK